MARWFLQDGSAVQELDEPRLRERLASGDLSGLELAHPEGDLAWRPLHDWPLFTEVVPFRGSAAAAAQKRARAGLFWHAASFLGVMAFLGPQPWFIFWGMGLAAHAFRAAPALLPGQDKIPDPVALPVPIPTAEPAPPPQLAPVEAAAPTGFMTDVDAALAELSAVGGDRVDGVALREGAQALEAALQGLADGSDPSAGAELQQALADAEGRVHAATDDATAEIFQAEAHAIAARLEAWQDAATAAERLKARQRTLLHQLHALRLDLARGDAPSPGADPVQAQVQRLRQEAIAAAEVDQDMARARRARRLT